MGIFSRTKPKQEPILVLHVGSSAVGGALFLPDALGAPRIFFSDSEPVAPDKELNQIKFFDRTMKALDSLSLRLRKASPILPQRVFCILASPWYVSQTRTLRLKKKEPFLFTEKMADELIKKEIELISAKNLSDYKKEQEVVRTIELKNIKTALNGYETSEPLYQKTQEVEMTIFISMAGENLLGEIEKIVAKHFTPEPVKFSSFAVASFTIVRDVIAKRDNFLLLDIGGEVTDIFMIKKNILRESISFPKGRNFLVRGVAESLGTSLDEAASLIALWKDRHAEDSVQARLDAIMQKLRTEWLSQFQDSLAHLSNDISIPGTVYVTTEGNFAEIFSDIIRAEQFSQYTLAESKFDITLVNQGILHDLVIFEDAAPRDPALAIDCVYINGFLVKTPQLNF